MSEQYGNIQFIEPFELTTLNQIFLTRQIIWKDQYRLEKDKISERICIKVFNDDELIFPDQLKKVNLNESNSSIRAVLLPNTSDQLIQFFKAREGLKPIQLTDIDKQFDQTKLSCFFSRMLRSQLFIQVKIVLEGRNTPLSDPFLIPLRKDSMKLAQFLIIMSQISHLAFKNKKGQIVQLTQEDLLNRVRYQVEYYKVSNEYYFLPGKRTQEKRTNFLKKVIICRVFVHFPGSEKLIGRHFQQHRVNSSGLLKGEDSVHKIFHSNRLLKHFSPNPTVLQIAVPKEMYEAKLESIHD